MAFGGQRSSEVEGSSPVDTVGGAGESAFQDHIDTFTPCGRRGTPRVVDS